MIGMVNKLFGWVRIAWCAEGSGGGPKIGQKGSKSWDHVGPGKLLMFGVREIARNRPRIVKFLGLK